MIDLASSQATSLNEANRIATVEIEKLTQGVKLFLQEEMAWIGANSGGQSSPQEYKSQLNSPKESAIESISA